MKYAGSIQSFVVYVLTVYYTGVLSSLKAKWKRKMCYCSVKFATKFHLFKWQVCYRAGKHKHKHEHIRKIRKMCVNRGYISISENISIGTRIGTVTLVHTYFSYFFFILMFMLVLMLMSKCEPAHNAFNKSLFLFHPDRKQIVNRKGEGN